jgi:hypothetical protein
MRNIQRNIIRNKYGNKALNDLWQSRQIKKYGLMKLKEIHKKCSPKSNTTMYEVLKKMMRLEDK